MWRRNNDHTQRYACRVTPAPTSAPINNPSKPRQLHQIHRLKVVRFIFALFLKVYSYLFTSESFVQNILVSLTWSDQICELSIAPLSIDIRAWLCSPTNFSLILKIYISRKLLFMFRKYFKYFNIWSSCGVFADFFFNKCQLCHRVAFFHV